MQLFIGSELDGETLFLTEEESWHCAKVLRKRNGDILSVIDGKGNLYSSKIVSDNPKKILLNIESKEAKLPSRNYKLHLAIAPTKNTDRIEWFVEKAVEIGVDEISFLQCKNSERKILKIDRIQKIVESAVKQSLQFYIPKLNDLIAYQKFIEQQDASHSKFIAHCQTTNLPFLTKILKPTHDSLVLIGPEGDFTIEEVNLAKSIGFQEISLGATRLRTETAALYAVNAFSVLSNS
jgi:16S rRNA (uracil1498-N3)-methyltransferase